MKNLFIIVSLTNGWFPLIQKKILKFFMIDAFLWKVVTFGTVMMILIVTLTVITVFLNFWKTNGIAEVHQYIEF